MTSIVGFFCETTLLDQDQRTSLIGIMPGRISVNALPLPLSLGAFIRVAPLPPADTSIKVEIFVNDQRVADLDAKSVVPPPEAENEFGLDALHINIGRIVAMLNEPAVIKMTVGIGGDVPVLVAVLRVDKEAVLPASS